MNKKVVLSFLCGAALASTACAMTKVDGAQLTDNTAHNLVYHEQVCSFRGGFTQLHAAVRQGKKELLPLLLKIYDVDVTDNAGDTPLHWAAHENNAEILEALIDAGADVNAKNTCGVTPLFELIAPSDQKIVDLINSYRKIIKPEEQVHKGRLGAVVVRMVRVGASVNELCSKTSIHTRTQLSMTPLHYAIEKCNVFMVQCLLTLGADCRILNGADFDAPSWARVLVTSGFLRRDAFADTRQLILEMVQNHVLSRPAN